MREGGVCMVAVTTIIHYRFVKLAFHYISQLKLLKETSECVTLTKPLDDFPSDSTPS